MCYITTEQGVFRDSRMNGMSREMSIARRRCPQPKNVDHGYDDVQSGNERDGAKRYF